MPKAIHIIVLTITVFSVGVYFFVGNSNKITNRDSTGSSIVAFGDSLMEGAGVTDENNFVFILSKRLQTEIINEGISGNTTAQGLVRVEDVLAHDPRVVIVLLGGNDALQRIPANETFSNLDQIIKKIHKSGSSVLLVGVQGGILRDNYKKEFKRLAKKRNTAFVPDILDGLIGNLKYMSDSVHPNAIGHQIIADKIEPVLNDLLQ